MRDLQFEPETPMRPATPLTYYGPPDRSSTRMGTPSTQEHAEDVHDATGVDCPRGHISRPPRWPPTASKTP